MPVKRKPYLAPVTMAMVLREYLTDHNYTCSSENPDGRYCSCGICEGARRVLKEERAGRGRIRR